LGEIGRGEGMREIRKYTLKPSCEFMIPKHAEILSVATQHNEAQMWVLVDPKNDCEARRFRCYGTGHAISERNIEYLGTFQIDGGTLIFHAFEVIE
jgi:hypothetical protein